MRRPFSAWRPQRVSGRSHGCSVRAEGGRQRARTPVALHQTPLPEGRAVAPGWTRTWAVQNVSCVEWEPRRCRKSGWRDVDWRARRQDWAGPLRKGRVRWRTDARRQGGVIGRVIGGNRHQECLNVFRALLCSCRRPTTSTSSRTTARIFDHPVFFHHRDVSHLEAFHLWSSHHKDSRRRPCYLCLYLCLCPCSCQRKRSPSRQRGP